MNSNIHSFSRFRIVAMVLAKEGAISASRFFGACTALLIAAAYGMNAIFRGDQRHLGSPYH